jgi:hypothetical protein
MEVVSAGGEAEVAAEQLRIRVEGMSEGKPEAQRSPEWKPPRPRHPPVELSRLLIIAESLLTTQLLPVLRGVRPLETSAAERSNATAALAPPPKSPEQYLPGPLLSP